MLFRSVTDLDMLTIPAAVQIVAGDSQQASLRAPAVNAATGLAGIPAGGTALVRTTGLPQDLTGWTVTVGGLATTFAVDKNGVLSIRVPDKISLGPQIVQLARADGTGPQPIALQVDAAPQVIASAFDNTVLNGTGAAVSATSPANAGDTITLSVSQLNPVGDVWITLNEIGRAHV